MGKTNLGRVSLVPRGTYDSTVAYKRLDVVEFEGCSYLFMRDSTGVAPTGDNVVTMLIAKKGDKGDADLNPNQIVNDLTTGGTDKVASAETVKTLNGQKIGEASSDGKVYGRKNKAWVEVAEKTDVLTKTNTAAFTPTGGYHPATKKYVDDKAGDVQVLAFNPREGNKWYKIVDLEDKGADFYDIGILTIFAMGDYASYYVSGNGESVTRLSIDGGNSKDFTDTFDKLRWDYISSGNATLSIHVNTQLNAAACIAYKPLTQNVRKYYTAPTEQTVTGSDSFEMAIPTGYIVTSDNLTKITKKTAAEYNAINPKDSKTMYALTD